MQIELKEQMNFVDVGDATIGHGIKTELPFYNAHIDKPSFLSTLLDRDLDTTHTAGMTIDMTNLREMEAQMNVLGAGLDKRLKGKVLLVDPRTEAMYFGWDEARSGYRKLNNIPIAMRNILRDATTKNHDSIWTQNLNNPSAITKFAEFSVDTVSAFATVPLTITPFISRKSSLILIDLAFQLNKEANGIALRSYGKKSAGFYLNLDAAIFEYDQSKVVYITKKIEEAFKGLDDMLLYIRIQGAEDLTFDGFGRVMTFLNYLYRKRHETPEKNILIMTSGLNTGGIVGINNGANGMDEVVDGKNSLSQGFGRVMKKKEPYFQFGKYYEPTDMMDEKYTVIRKFVEDKGVLPCAEEVCKRAAHTFIHMNYRQYAAFARTHRIESRNREIREIKQDIMQGNMRGLEDRFGRSRHTKIQQYARLVA